MKWHLSMLNSSSKAVRFIANETKTSNAYIAQDICQLPYIISTEQRILYYYVKYMV